MPGDGITPIPKKLLNIPDNGTETMPIIVGRLLYIGFTECPRRNIKDCPCSREEFVEFAGNLGIKGYVLTTIIRPVKFGAYCAPNVINDWDNTRLLSSRPRHI